MEKYGTLDFKDTFICDRCGYELFVCNDFSNFVSCIYCPRCYFLVSLEREKCE